MSMLDASLFVEARFTKIFKSHIVTVSLTANRGEEVNSLVEQSIMVRLMLSQAITCLVLKIPKRKECKAAVYYQKVLLVN